MGGKLPKKHERINGILKTEFPSHRADDLVEARRIVAQSAAIYNQERSHQALKYKTPDEIHRALWGRQERFLLAA